jgi:CMP-N,N'-diacetyllegionaminic acid synthase
MCDSIIGIIPARGGSKTVSKKNIKLLAGKPLIAYTIEAALASQIINRVIVSTDDVEIMEVAKKAGAEVPFCRPGHLAQDETSDRPVIKHVLEWLSDHEGFQPDGVAYLRPTSPFKTSQIIDNCNKFLMTTGADSVRTVTSVEGVHHPYWMFTQDEVHRMHPLIPAVSIEKYYQRQLLPPVYRLNGVVDVVQSHVLLGDGGMYGKDQRMFEIPESASFDIDTELDFLICEQIIKKRI